MKKSVWVAAFVLAIGSGCVGSGAPGRAKGIDDGVAAIQDRGGSAIAAGESELRIVSSLKTHKPGAHSLDKGNHGTAGYRLLVEIDGQSIEMAGSLCSENIEGSGVPAPETGDGIRYRFTGQVRLKAGRHSIVVTLPTDEIRLAADLDLEAGSRNALVIDPTYASLAGTPRRSIAGTTSFTEGIRELRILLNDRELPTRGW